jgi:DNA-directed RNA polymerase specialized sigma24 family protein
LYRTASYRRTDKLRERFETTVRDAYRRTLAHFPGEIHDAIQQFWTDMATGKALALSFDPARDSEEASYLRVIARNRAISYLKRVVQRAEVVLDGVMESTLLARDERVENIHEWLIENICGLLMTNQLEVHHAMILLLKTCADLGPAKLASSHLDASLFSLLKLLHESTEGSGLTFQPLWQAVGYRLELPAGRPYGLFTLKELAERAGIDEKGSMQRWLSESLRVCQRSLGEEPGEAAKRISQLAAERYRRNVNSRIAFLSFSVHGGKTTPLEGLLWSWHYVFGVSANSIGEFSGEKASSGWIARVDFIGCGPVPSNLSDRLMGLGAGQTVRERMKTDCLDPERAVRNLEDRYRRSQKQDGASV